jgi:hypothetical protein
MYSSLKPDISSNAAKRMIGAALGKRVINPTKVDATSDNLIIKQPVQDAWDD